MKLNQISSENVEILRYIINTGLYPGVRTKIKYKKKKNLGRGFKEVNSIQKKLPKNKIKFISGLISTARR